MDLTLLGFALVALVVGAYRIRRPEASLLFGDASRTSRRARLASQTLGGLLVAAGALLLLLALNP
ncbi:hypothetical protein [Halomarina ordinaria]|uniref:ABC transporter permease n=1 Tax=Halomarina ordinaria TaxID=3033939 RepID=A0ABD5UHP8_9EURY|nr:hypothetical protein [Halomarina sp. PSRA2]